MIDVHLVINGRWFTPLLLTYDVRQEIKYRQTVTTLDGTEHYFGQTERDIILFTMMPHTDWMEDDFNALMSTPLVVEYERRGEILKRQFALDCDLRNQFLLLSCDRLRRYKGGEIRLRALEVNK